ncbi:MAG: hypothetical protein JSV33_06555 [bacterium]|nr:MAG: hypothetical protein JSV33_06555 [bacterium]
MSTNMNLQSGISLIVKRALEGRISPLNFMLVLGFFSSLVLLYISLHVYLFTISKDITTNRERRAEMMDQNTRLTAIYNDLIAPERIIPLVERMGLRAGSGEEVKRFALYEYGTPQRTEAAGIARVSSRKSDEEIFLIEPESR